MICKQIGIGEVCYKAEPLELSSMQPWRGKEVILFMMKWGTVLYANID